MDLSNRSNESICDLLALTIQMRDAAKVMWPKDVPEFEKDIKELEEELYKRARNESGPRT